MSLDKKNQYAIALICFIAQIDTFPMNSKISKYLRFVKTALDAMIQRSELKSHALHIKRDIVHGLPPVSIKQKIGNHLKDKIESRKWMYITIQNICIVPLSSS